MLTDHLLINTILTTLCFTIALCGLLLNKMKRKDYILILAVNFFISFVTVIFVTQILTVPAIICSLIIIGVGQKEHKIFNICMACVGYMFVVASNELTLLIFDVVFHITDAMIVSNYYTIFSAFYLVVEILMLIIVRFILYRILKIKKLLGSQSKIKYGVLAEVISFVIIFVANIILGFEVGYSQSALILNTVLFGFCFVISGIVLFYCAKQIQADEKRKIDEAKSVMTQNYINGLECMIDESRSIRHDYKNILSTMSGYLQEDDYVGLKDYFNANIRNFVIAADKQGQIWNSLAEINPIELKGFLYEKALKASSLQVDFRVITEQGTVLQYHDMEKLIRVFGNLMDNAIEAAAKSAEKLVDLRIGGIQNGVSVIIRNSFAEKPDVSRMFQKGYTTKGDGHGEGLYYVKEYLDQHNDIDCYFSIERNEFVQSLKIMNM